MPLMMDEGINVDDLFGETGPLELGLPSHTNIKALAQRWDEMRLSGCCQKIAWSKQGCIAYISQDASRVNLRSLQCQPSDGKWALSEETPLHQTSANLNGHDLVHLCWNDVGSDLAVVDSAGRVSIYNIGFAINHLNLQRQATSDPADDTSQVVGIMWLSLLRSQYSFNQASKVHGRWAYSPFRRSLPVPVHPALKSGLVCVTKSGVIKLIYQNPDGKWAEISTDFKNTGYSDRLLTHAAISPIENGVLVVTHSACQKICLYRLQITWEPDKYNHKDHPGVFPTPSFRFTHSKVEIPANIPNALRPADDQPGSLPAPTASLYTLTRLDVVLAIQESGSASNANPCIVAVFSLPPSLTPDPSQQLRPASVIVRWQLDKAPLGLHPKFDEVSSKKGTAQNKPRDILRRLDDIHCDRYPVSIDHIEYGNIVAITFDDSSVAFYDPKAMSALSGMDDMNTVSSLAQAGFHYPLDFSAGLHTSFSPSGCAAATLDLDGQVHLRVMEHSYGPENELYDESKFSAVVVALTLAFCRGSGSEYTTDDIIMLIRRQLSPDGQTALVNEVYRALPVACDHTQEQERHDSTLMRNTWIPRGLSLQIALGFRNEHKPRTFASAIAWTIHQLRHAALLSPVIFTYSQTLRASGEQHDPDVLRMILGNTRWVLDLSHYFLCELFNLVDELEPVLDNQEALSQKLKSINSLPLFILLSSMSRAFLRNIYRGMQRMQAGANAPFTGDSRLYFIEVCRTITSSPVRLEVLMHFTEGISTAVKDAYHGAGFGDAERPGPEKDLLVNARIPPVLVTAVATLFRQTLPAIRPQVNLVALYEADYSWLGVVWDRDQRSEVPRKARNLDIIKKSPMRMTAAAEAGGGGGGASRQAGMGMGMGPEAQSHRRKRCVRCCAVSEASSTMPSRSRVITLRFLFRMGLVRQCVCGALWTLEPVPEMG